MLYNNTFRNTFKHGVVMGLVFCCYTVVMWLTSLDTTYLNIGQYIDMAIIILPLSFTFWAIKQESEKHKINLFNRVIIAIYVNLISFIIYDPFLYIYHQFINPDWYSSVLILKETELILANTDATLIVDHLNKLKEASSNQSGLFRLNAIIPSVIIIPTLIAVISLIFIKTKSSETKV